MASENRPKETEQCRWCEMEGIFEAEYAGQMVWWCEDCSREYNQDMVYQQWMSTQHSEYDDSEV